MPRDASMFWCPEGVAPVVHYGQILGRLWGGLLPPPTDKPCILAVRGLSLFASEDHEVLSVPKYDDSGILFVPGHEPFLFPMSSHPFQKDSRSATDGNGDGVPDVATVRTGLYKLTLAIEKPFPVWIFATMAGSASIPCARDLNHDGRIDAREHEKQLTATAILLHCGYDAPAGSEHRSSIGCATASLRSLEVIARAGRQILYRLVDADVAIEAAKFVTADTLPPAPEGMA